jgi:uroporphyrinogen decarboxylase
MNNLKLTASHRQILEDCLADKPGSRTPVSLWRHFPVDDQDPETLAAAVSAFQDQFDFDFIKVTSASSFCTKDWGSKDTWKGDPEGTREYDDKVINRPEDWVHLKKLDPHKGHLKDQLTCLSLLVKKYSPATPIIQTIFSPMAQAKNLVGRDNLEVQMRLHPDALAQGLKTITETIIDFIEACKATGIDGFFYAVQHAQANLLTLQEFQDFQKKYDLQILKSMQDKWLNVAHFHGENIYFDQMLDYPAPIFNWHDRETYPTLKEAQSKFSGTLCGGLKQWDTLAYGTPEAVRAEAKDAIRSSRHHKFILGTGCVTPIIAPYGNIMAARQAVEE